MAANDKTLASYPWYVNDWRGSKTRVKLSTAGRGMFRELLDYCWEVGFLPTDERSLVAISGGSKAEFRREWNTIKESFYQQDGVLLHHKVEEKRPKLVAFRESRSSNAKGRRHAGTSVQASAEASAKTSVGASGPPFFLLPSSDSFGERTHVLPLADANGNCALPVKRQRTTRPVFVKPTVEEIAEYAKEKGLLIRAQKFWDSYESKGWLVGRAPMRDWRAAVRNWATNDFDRLNSPSTTAYVDPPSTKFVPKPRPVEDDDDDDDFMLITPGGLRQ